MTVPLVRGERLLGVLEVLEGPEQTDAAGAELLGLFGRQAAIALALPSPPA
jgi:GAF domain-containing protein